MTTITPLHRGLCALLLSACFAASAQTIDSRLDRLYAEKNWSSALALIEADLASKPGDVAMQIQRGVVLSNLNRTEDALAAFRKVSAEHPDMPGPLNNIAVLLAAQGDLNGAKESLERAIRTNPSYATTYENLGDLYSHMAAEAYRKALRMDKSTAPSRPKLQMLDGQQSGSKPPTTVAKMTAPAGGTLPVLTAIDGSATTPRPATVAPKVTTATPAVTPKPASALPAAPVVSKPATVPGPSAATAAAPALATAPVAAARALAPASAVVVAKVTQPPIAPAVSASAAVAGPKPPVASSESTAGAEERKLAKAVAAWAKAWAGRDMQSYIAAYAADFKGKSASRSAWESERRDRILGKSNISVSVDNLRFKVNASKAEVQLEQIYSADKLRVTTKKTLSFVKVGGRWLISGEVAGK